MKVYALAALSPLALQALDVAHLQEALDHRFVAWYKDFTGYEGEVDISMFSDLDLGLELDKVSNDYFENMRFQAIDAAVSEIEDCDPYQQNYAQPDELHNDQQIVEDCEFMNRRAINKVCAIATCKIDMAYVRNVYNGYFDQNFRVSVWDDRYSVKNIWPSVSNFEDYEGEIRHCGEYPYRYRYQYKNGRYSCCQGKVYSPRASFGTCCANGNVVKEQSEC